MPSRREVATNVVPLRPGLVVHRPVTVRQTEDWRVILGCRCGDPLCPEYPRRDCECSSCVPRDAAKAAEMRTRVTEGLRRALGDDAADAIALAHLTPEQLDALGRMLPEGVA